MGFTYKNKSTANVISVPLIIASFDTEDSVHGISRETQIGSQTIWRQTPNDYGVIEEPALIEDYSLIKSNGEAFTDEEQIAVESWLTSSNYSSELDLYDNCTGEYIATYSGKFVETEWQTGFGGYVGITFSFQCDTAYPYRKVSKTYEIDGELTINHVCPATNTDFYIYPTIKFCQTIGTSDGSDVVSDGATEAAPEYRFTITSVSDGGKTMNVKPRDGLTVSIDCRRYIVRGETASGALIRVISFKDLGWSDVGNVYWLRLLPGTNELVVTGNGMLTISYNYPYKKVGGWL